MPLIKNIILDWSGTLVNDLDPVIEACNEIFHAFGKPGMTKEEFREKFFLPFPKFYEIYLPEASMEEIEEHYHKSFKNLQIHVELLPHALEFLEFCESENMEIFLLSTIHSDHYQTQSTRLDVRRFFKEAYVQAMDKRETITGLMEKHNLHPEETIFIGDMQHDIETAHHAGIHSCAVMTGYDSLQKLKQAGPDLLFRDLSELQSYLTRHRAKQTEFPIATVGALIFNPAGEMLMIQTHKWSNLWGIPGGKIKTNEASIDALHREVREETGLEITDPRFIMVQDCIGSTEFYRPAHFLLLNYTAQTEKTKVTLNEEAENYQWTSWENVWNLPLNKPTSKLLQEVQKNQPK